MNSLVDLMIQHKTVGIKEEGFTLKSGKTSYWYVNCRNLSKTRKVLNDTAKLVVDYLNNNNLLNNIDYVLGVPEGGTLLGHEVSRLLIEDKSIKDNIYSLRSTPKKHGDPANKYWTNANVPKSVILLEDVTSTGGSVIELAKTLKSMNIEVKLILSLVDRLQLDPKTNKTVKENMKNEKLDFKSILTAKDFLSKIVNAFDDNRVIKDKINKEYYQDFKENSPIKLVL
ncbi:MAG: Unknown protein [uncultured Campylobacterales bacterium]|uniref:Phosphoribosyltransferase domain-containing protein n=1 Tax=uncultured Campylobacterales bacterium TaxID=352960 RepID=A0A6S6SLN3_9BACT|nr:MAG: Unknown protein [uncultured Campylobacterales bacterium]